MKLANLSRSAPLQRTAVAGLLGTLVFDTLGLAFTGAWWDIPNLLGAKLGSGLIGGLALHYAIGVVLALLYVAVAPQLPGNRFTKPLLFITVQTVLGVWLFMLPLLGAGPLGLGLGAMVPVFSLLRHWGYALVLGTLIPTEDTDAAVLSVA
jgi:hypothetical protein